VDALREWRASIAADSFLCKLEAEVPSLSLPNWLAIMAGLTPEVHGLLGNRAPPEPDFSSLVSVMTLARTRTRIRTRTLTLTLNLTLTLALTLSR